MVARATTRSARWAALVSALACLAVIGSAPVAVAAAPAATLVASAPPSAVAGTPVAVRVTARTAGGSVATDYRGSIAFTSDDTRAPVLPATYRFTAADHGTHLFAGVVLHQAGSRTVTATDTARAALTGRTAAIAVSPGAATRFAVATPPTAVAGSPFAVQLTAKDPFYNIVRAFRGTVTFTSTDPRTPVLPAAYTFTAADGGVHTFPGVALHTAGNRTLTAHAGPVTGTSGPIAVSPGAISRFAVVIPATATAGAPFPLTVTAKDPFFNVVTGYRGTIVSPNAGDPRVDGYTFTAADRGSHTFDHATLLVEGTRGIDVWDSASPLVRGEGVIVITAGPAARLSVTTPSIVAAGERFGLSVTMADHFGNVATSYRGTIAFSFQGSPPGADVTPSTYTFTAADEGEVSFSPPSGGLVPGPGSWIVVATDVADPSITGGANVTVPDPTS